MSDSQQKTIATYQRLMNANATVQSFLVARKLGIFEHLKDGQKTANELAESLELSKRPLELLLDGLWQNSLIRALRMLLGFQPC